MNKILGFWQKLKPPIKFWLGISFYLILILIVLFSVCNFITYNSEASVRLYTYIENVPLADYYNESFNLTFSIEVILKLKNDEGPFSPVNKIYGDELLLIQSPFVSETFLDKIWLNFSMRSFETWDEEPDIISIEISNTSLKNGQIINLSKDNGFLSAQQSGTKQIKMDFTIKVKNEDKTRKASTYYDNDAIYNKIFFDTNEAYHKYQQIKISTIMLITAAFAFSLPATYKTIKGLYPKNNNS